MASLCKSVMSVLVFFKAPFSVLQFSHSNDLADDVMSYTAIYAVDTTRYFKCDHVSDL